MRVAALALAALLAAGALARSVDPSVGVAGYFENEIAAFEAADRRESPPTGAIVFTGSSSIRLWTTLARDMAPLPVIRRGFGGAHVEHVVANASRVVVAYAPRAVVVFAGGNDLAAGKTPAAIADDYRELIALVEARLPESDLWLLSSKPSPRRRALRPAMAELDRRLQALAAASPRVHFIETGASLLRDDGALDAVYARDGLHLDAEGYRRWTAVLRPRLLAAYGDLAGATR